MGFNESWNTAATVAHEEKQARAARPVCDVSRWTVHPSPVGFTGYMAQFQDELRNRDKFGAPDARISVGEMGESAGTKLNRAKRQAAGYQTLGLRI
jgi:hypothetical protein